jgi:hypothetical protein
MSAEEPKKRGRKPKGNEPPKKRGRKPKDKFGTLDINPHTQTDENIILHLPLKNIPEPQPIENPEPFEDATMPFSKYSDMIDVGVKPCVTQINTTLNDGDSLTKIIKDRQLELSNQSGTHSSKIFIEFIEYNKSNKWPSSTTIDCLWDCHSFVTEPYGIPIKKIKDTYHMFGNFCSPECAAAYNFDLNGDSNVWERYSLLNHMYNNNEPIFIANSKLLLKRFGGRYHIDEYRDINRTKKKYNVVFPPVISVIPTIEEINYDLLDDKTFTIDKNNIKKATDEYKLKRSKPLPDFKNTLEASMNLKYI